MGLFWTTWFDGVLVRFGELVTVWDRLRRSPRLSGIRVGALGTMPYRGVPLLISVDGAGLLRVGRAVRFVEDGGVWCVAAPPGQTVKVEIRNLYGRVVQAFDVPASVLPEAPRPRGTRVPDGRRVVVVRFPVGVPSPRAVRTVMPGVWATSPTARAHVPALAPVHVAAHDGTWVVRTDGMPPMYLVSDDTETLCRVAVRIARNSPRSAP